ncbi:MAG: hypothetical protein GJ680_18635 [Alteromonadaceae bacterium]|nr:hypothetical protein [Alteromonadaceae bacterium]
MIRILTAVLLALSHWELSAHGFPAEWDPLALENLQKSAPDTCHYSYVVEITDTAFLKAHAHPKEELVAIVAIGVIDCGKGHSPAGVYLTNGILAYNVLRWRNGIFDPDKSHAGVDALIKAKKVGFIREFLNPDAPKVFNYHHEMFHRGGVSFWRVTKSYAPFWERLKASDTLAVKPLYSSEI